MQMSKKLTLSVGQAHDLEEKMGKRDVTDEMFGMAMSNRKKLDDIAAIFKDMPLTESIIVERIDKNTVRLRLLAVNHDQSVEEAVKGLPYVNSNLTSANFPSCHNGKTGVEEVELFLYRPVPKSENWSHKKVEKAIDKAGFISADMPELAILKDYADELWEADIRFYITAFGASSRWQYPDGFVFVAYLRLFPDFRGFRLYRLEDDWSGRGWFVVRRK